MKSNTSVTKNQTTSPAISSAVTEIRDLHAKILDAARTSLEKAIRIGELLTGVKAELKHGEWLPWLEANVPFSERTIRRYMACFENRERLKSGNVTDLGSAYALLSDGTADRDERMNALTGVIRGNAEEFESCRSAIAEIRDRELYQITHKTFDDYCYDKLGMSAETVNELIEFTPVSLA